VKVLILGAGQGKRLLPLTEEIPKALLDIGGQRLIERQIDAFAACGIKEFVVLTGYRANLMAEVLADVEAGLEGVSIRTVHNPFFAVSDNLASCWMARHEMDRDFIQVNGDNLFRADMVERVLAAPQVPVTAVINHKDSYDNDDMKVMLDSGRLTEIGKTLPLEAVDAEDQREPRDGHRRHDRQRRRERDEPRAGNPGRAFRTDHRDEQQRDLVAEAEIDPDRLRDEQRRERHIDVGAVEVEAVAGRHDEADDRLRAARLFELLDQAGQGRFGRRGTEHEQQFGLEIGDQAEDREAAQPRDRAEVR